MTSPSIRRNHPKDKCSGLAVSGKCHNNVRKCRKRLANVRAKSGQRVGQNTGKCQGNVNLRKCRTKDRKCRDKYREYWTKDRESRKCRTKHRQMSGQPQKVSDKTQEASDERYMYSSVGQKTGKCLGNSGSVGQHMQMSGQPQKMPDERQKVSDERQEASGYVQGPLDKRQANVWATREVCQSNVRKCRTTQADVRATSGSVGQTQANVRATPESVRQKTGSVGSCAGSIGQKTGSQMFGQPHLGKGRTKYRKCRTKDRKRRVMYRDHWTKDRQMSGQLGKCVRATSGSVGQHRQMSGQPQEGDVGKVSQDTRAPQA